MIFVTVGTQLPFDRLIKMVDEVAKCLDEPIVGQIGEGSYQPSNFEWSSFTSRSEFNELVKAARVIVGHAGMGTILAARSAAKPLCVMPRRADLGEHRNDHQFATASQLKGAIGFYEIEGNEMLLKALSRSHLPSFGYAHREEKLDLCDEISWRVSAVIRGPR